MKIMMMIYKHPFKRLASRSRTVQISHHSEEVLKYASHLDKFRYKRFLHESVAVVKQEGRCAPYSTLLDQG
jgi:hypothetical protein